MIIKGEEKFQYILRNYFILVIYKSNVLRAHEFFQGMGLKVVTGSRYLGVFIGDSAAQQ